MEDKTVEELQSIIFDASTELSKRSKQSKKAFHVQFPHMLTLHVENSTSQPHKTGTSSNTTFNIGSISGEQLQVGNNNTQSVTINVQKLVEEVAKSNDPEEKNLLKQLLENSTVGSVIGAGTSALISLL
ncbi:TPA: hypothetical protein ACX6SA_000296 [Photobacterium damselae]